MQVRRRCVGVGNVACRRRRGGGMRGWMGGEIRSGRRTRSGRYGSYTVGNAVKRARDRRLLDRRDRVGFHANRLLTGHLHLLNLLMLLLLEQELLLLLLLVKLLLLLL